MACMLVEDAEAAVRHQQQYARHVSTSGLPNRVPNIMGQEIRVVITESLSDYISSDDGEDREYEHDEEVEQG